VPQILLVDDVQTLDEISMTVYLFDWYWGANLLLKQDVAARRLGKLINMTRLHDKMRADYLASAEKTVAWIDEKSAWLKAITFDNTLAGIKARIVEINSFKAGEKATVLAANLDNDSLFYNLAVRLKQASRVEFAPAGKTPQDIKKRFDALNGVESDVSQRCQQELGHQLDLDEEAKRFRSDAEWLQNWIYSENKSYVSVAEKSAITPEAKANLFTLSVHDKDVKT
jgi:hypothetical protein